MKVCNVCLIEKPKSAFNPTAAKCKPCLAEYAKKRYYTKEGLIKAIYSGQLCSSKKRGHPKPSYTREELEAWLVKQPNFEQLYTGWVTSGYDRKNKPSCDRLDDYAPYTLNNLQLTTFTENEKRGYVDRVNGVNNKISRGVQQLTLQGELIKEYYSQSSAQRETGVFQANIHKCCKGLRATSGGFKWRFTDEV